METRVAILETPAQQTQVTLQAIREDIRDLRREVLAQRSVHERDFRLTFGAIIATALGLATLIARVAHWL